MRIKINQTLVTSNASTSKTWPRFPHITQRQAGVSGAPIFHQVINWSTEWRSRSNLNTNSQMKRTQCAVDDVVTTRRSEEKLWLRWMLVWTWPSPDPEFSGSFHALAEWCRGSGLGLGLGANLGDGLHTCYRKWEQSNTITTVDDVRLRGFKGGLHFFMEIHWKNSVNMSM